jgi:hypothetical protein
MKNVINILSTILIVLLLSSCATSRRFTVSVIDNQGTFVKDTSVLVRPYGIFSLSQRIKGVKYRMPLQNIVLLIINPLGVSGYYLVEPKPQQNFVIKQQ